MLNLTRVDLGVVGDGMVVDRVAVTHPHLIIAA